MPFNELFAAAGGITLAVIASLTAFATALFGFKKFQLPYDTADGFPRTIANFVLFVPFVLCFLFITPRNAHLAALIALGGLPLGYFCFSRYGRAFRNHRYTRPIPPGWMLWRTHREAVIVGGDVLTREAEAKLATHPQPLQGLLKSAEYEPDEIWVRESRIKIQQRVERWFYAFLLCAIISVAAASLALQAALSNTAPLESARRLWNTSQPQNPATATPLPRA